MAFYGTDPLTMVTQSKAEKFALEFSSALPYQEDMELLFNEYPYAKLAHNYFPAPAIPFVLNLASGDPLVRTQSIEHVLKGLRWSKKANASFYCAHAGFCIDPKPEELGQKLQQSTESINREKHWNLFLDSIHTILPLADALGIDFYIENNVTAKMNLNVHGESPLLCSDPVEIEQLIKTVNHPRLGILLDTAHLKVSANALHFSAEEAVKTVASYVRAIHHSDNEGELDNNQPIQSDYWFGQFMPLFSNIPHVLEVKKQSITEIKNQIAKLKAAQKTKLA
jgi:sugar phosphate isomerase/epimerase